MSNQLTGSGNGRMIVRVIGGGGFGAAPLGALVFPATVNVADPAGLTDGLQAQLSVDASGRLRSVISPASGVVFPTQPSVLADSVGVTTRVVAPGAGAVIATITPAAGTWDIQVTTSFDGAVAAAEINNMDFRKAGATVSVLIAPSVANVVTEVRKFRMVLSGAQAVSINAVAAATAGVGYTAELACIRIA